MNTELVVGITSATSYIVLMVLRWNIQMALKFGF